MPSLMLLGCSAAVLAAQAAVALSLARQRRRLGMVERGCPGAKDEEECARQRKLQGPRGKRGRRCAAAPAAVRAYELVLDGAPVGPRIDFLDGASAQGLRADVASGRVEILMLGDKFLQVSMPDPQKPPEPGRVSFRTAPLSADALAAMPVSGAGTLAADGRVPGLEGDGARRMLQALGFVADGILLQNSPQGNG